MYAKEVILTVIILLSHAMYMKSSLDFIKQTFFVSLFSKLSPTASSSTFMTSVITCSPSCWGKVWDVFLVLPAVRQLHFLTHVVSVDLQQLVTPEARWSTKCSHTWSHLLFITTVCNWLCTSLWDSYQTKISHKRVSKWTHLVSFYPKTIQFLF